MGIFLHLIVHNVNLFKMTSPYEQSELKFAQYCCACVGNTRKNKITTFLKTKIGNHI